MIINITLRKRNSVTSIVLYIYNIYYQIMGEYEIELSHLLDFIKKFGKTESAARVSLSRMVKGNILINREKNGQIYYELTKEGLQNIKDWNKGLERFFQRYRQRHDEWDNKWITLSLINFKKSVEENHSILDNLQELGYREVANNIWLFPYQMTDEIKTLLEKQNVKYLCTIGSISFNMDRDKFLNKVFQVNELKKNYQQFIIDSKKMIQEIDKDDIKDGEILPYLFKLGWSFYDIVTRDSALPEYHLQKWTGDKAVSLMKEFRENLVKKVGRYFKSRVSQ